MPDADRIGKLSRRWTITFKKVYEGFYDHGEVADEIMKSLVKDIKDYGDSPIYLLKRASSRLQEIQNAPLFRSSHDWKEEDQFIRSLASGFHKSNQRAIDIAIKAFKDILHDIRHNNSFYGDCYEETCKRYIRRVYEANFTGKIPISSETNIIFDNKVVDEKLREIDPIINDKINYLSERIVKKGNTKIIATKSRKIAIRRPSIDDDILNIGRST